MFERALEAAAAHLGRGERARAVRADFGSGEAGRQAAEIATRVFSAVPDVAIDRHVTIARSLNELRIHWRDQTRDEATRILVRSDHLYEQAAAIMEATARRVMIDEMRWRAMSRNGRVITEMPTWTMLAPRPLVDLLTRMGVEIEGDDAGAMARRINRIIELGSGMSSLETATGDRRRLVGSAMTPASGDGRPGLQVLSDRAREPDRITIVNAPTLPETAMVQLVGRPVGDLVDIGPNTNGMRITHAEVVGLGLRLTLEGGPVTLAHVPDGLDTRWLTLEGASPRL